MQLTEITEKLELKLSTEFGRAVLSTISVSRRKLWNHLTKPFLKRRDRNHPILSSYLVPAEKSLGKDRTNTAQKMLFSIQDFFSKCDEIRSFLRIWSHLLKKS